MERALVDFPSLQRLVLADKKAHCEGLCTLVFRADGKRTERLAPAKAGQYIALTGEFDGSRVTRAYTLASSPEETERDGVYVVTVKKAGILSGYLCDRLRVGDGISASVPYGDFVYDADTDVTRAEGGAEAPHKLVLYVWLKDGSKYYYTFDVTDQVDEAPEKRRVHIVIDGLTLPEPITGGDMEVAVDDWMVVNEDITM